MSYIHNHNSLQSKHVMYIASLSIRHLSQYSNNPTCAGQDESLISTTCLLYAPITLRVGSYIGIGVATTLCRASISGK